MTNIIFLDIDGPMIPATRYLENTNASWDQDLDPRCVMVLKKIVEKTDASIVFNSTHSTMLERDERSNPVWPGLIDQFVKAGLSGFIHSKISTSYPQVSYTGFDNALFDGVDFSDCPEQHRSPEHHPRLAAIFQWLEQNGGEGTKWVALDDVAIPHPNAFTVSYEDGLGVSAYNHTVGIFEEKGLVYL